MKKFIYIYFILIFAQLHSNEDFLNNNMDEINNEPSSEIEDSLNNNRDEIDKVINNEPNSEIQENNLAHRKNVKDPPYPKIKNLVAFKIGYFRPDSKRFRDIYSGGAIYGIESTFKTPKNIYGWASINIFPKSGNTLNANTPTNINLVFIGLGIKFTATFNKKGDSFYVGVGVLPSYLYIHDKSIFLKEKTAKWDAGGVFKTGFFVKAYERLFLDFFIDYKYLKMSIKDNDNKNLIFRSKVNLSGVTIGGSLALCF